MELFYALPLIWCRFNGKELNHVIIWHLNPETINFIAFLFGPRLLPCVKSGYKWNLKLVEFLTGTALLKFVSALIGLRCLHWHIARISLMVIIIAGY